MQSQGFLDERNQAGHGFKVVCGEVVATPFPDTLQRFVDLRSQPLLELAVLCELPESESQLMSSSASCLCRGDRNFVYGLPYGLVAGKQDSSVGRISSYVRNLDFFTYLTW